MLFSGFHVKWSTQPDYCNLVQETPHGECNVAGTDSTWRGVKEMQAEPRVPLLLDCVTASPYSS
jgi:hypothetical protein